MKNMLIWKFKKNDKKLLLYFVKYNNNKIYYIL